MFLLICPFNSPWGLVANTGHYLCDVIIPNRKEPEESTEIKSKTKIFFLVRLGKMLKKKGEKHYQLDWVCLYEEHFRP